MIPSQHTGEIGFTESERYLASLCERTFLSLWSHPNVFRARNKELADLLVVFGDDVVVFSDKSCEYKDGEQAWARWYRRAILRSANQLRRAAGWIRSRPNEIYMDVLCERRFPLRFPTNARVHLVAVATGARDASMRQLKGDGSLGIASDSDGTQPFFVGDLDPASDFIHVFDNISLDTVLRELDTVSDFVRYLGRRAAFFRAGRTIVAERELDLLAHYLTQVDDASGHDFIVAESKRDATTLVFAGDWDPFARSAPYTQKKIADEPSYLWDRIITILAGHADAGTLAFGQERGLAGVEANLRILASENRFLRRMLSRSIIEVRREAAIGEENFRVRTVLSPQRPDLAYLFVGARNDGADEVTHRKFRQSMMHAHMMITKLRRNEVQQAVGIAFAAEGESDETVDLAVMDLTQWTADDNARSEQLCVGLGWTRDTSKIETHETFYEYPTSPVPSTQVFRPHRRQSDEKDKKKKRRAQRDARKRSRG